MNVANMIYVGLGGFIGANLRYFLSLIVNKYYHEMFGTLLVNIIGSFLIAFFYGYFIEKNLLSPELKYFFPIGLLGSFTTFSSFSYTTIILINEGNYTRALTNILLSFVLCLIFAFLGLIISKLIFKI